jgi:hypothetical protein
MLLSKATSLCPAGHLPLKGGDRLAAPCRPNLDCAVGQERRSQPISPLVGEMPGRAEGGVRRG